MKKISWQIGQNIYPEHFMLLEHNIFSTSLNIFKDINFNFTGFIEFKLNKDLLKDNILKFEELSFITGDNNYIDISKNASISKLDLNEILCNQNNDERFYIGFNFNCVDIKEEYIEKYNDYIKFECYQLSLEVSNIRKFDIHLGEIKNNNILFNGVFPFNKLTEDEYTSQIYLDIEKLIYALKKVLKRNNKSKDSIGDELLNKALCSDISIFEYYFNQKSHVKMIFDKLSELYIKMSYFYGTGYFENKLVTEYKHNNQRSCFDSIIKKIHGVLTINSQKYVREYFEYKDGKFFIKEFDVSKYNNKKVYLKSRASNNNILKNIKISSVERLDYINMHALEGVKVINQDEYIEIDFSSNIEELKYIEQDKNISFVLELDSEDKFYLYYQK